MSMRKKIIALIIALVIVIAVLYVIPFEVIDGCAVQVDYIIDIAQNYVSKSYTHADLEKIFYSESRSSISRFKMRIIS